MNDSIVSPTQPKAVVLVIDDEPRNRSIVRSYLPAAYSVVEAEGGRQALSLLAKEPVDLVLLDVLMPDMNGFEVCSEIKAMKRTDYLPVLLLTSLRDQEDRNAGLAAGADDFLTKPIDRHELRLRVRSFLRLRQQDVIIRRQLEDLRRMQQLKDDLFSLIVHDLRHPLTGMKGYFELIKNDLAHPEGANIKEWVDRGVGSAVRLQQLIDGILDLHYIEEKQVPIHRERVPVRQPVSQAMATLDGAIKAWKIGLELHIEDDPIAVLDSRLVQRCVENLLANALKYSKPGESIDIYVRPDGDGVVIEVADHGPGIREDMLASVFDKFVGTDQQGGSNRRGYGLGLHLVRTVVTAHGGDVSVANRKEGGAIFRLFFPCDAPVAALASA